jgi:hypothetical protein
MSSRVAPSAAIAKSKRSAQSLKAERREFYKRYKAYEPGPIPRKAAKVLDSGARAEVKIDRGINAAGRHSGMISWRGPGVKGTRLAGGGMRPDGAGYLDALKGLIADQEPDVKRRLVYNFLVSCKSQHSAGSALQKILQEIRDLGHHCDMTGVVACVILDVAPHLLNPRQLAEYKAYGARHAVAVLTLKEVTEGELPDALVTVALQRKQLRNRTTPRGKYVPTKANQVHEQGLSERIRDRRNIQRSVRAQANAKY